MLRKHLGPQDFSHSRQRSPVVFVAVGDACLGHKSSVSTSGQFQPVGFELIAHTVVNRAIEIDAAEARAEIHVQAFQSPAQIECIGHWRSRERKGTRPRGAIPLEQIPNINVPFEQPSYVVNVKIPLESLVYES